MMRRVEFTEAKVLHGSMTYYAGDIKLMPKDEADFIIDAGWGKDADTGESGRRSTEPAEMQPDNVRQVLC
jgi:hypothetical protein